MALPDSTPARTSKRTRGLYIAVLLAIAVGIVVGLIAPKTAVQLKPLGDGFIKLIKMTIAPLIFCTVVGGIAGMRTMKAVGKAGGLAILYFEIMSTLALVIGLVIVNVIGPGHGVNLDPASLNTSSIETYISASKHLSTVAFLLAIIPDTLIGAFTGGDLLPVLLIAILFGFAVQQLGERGEPVLKLVGQIGQVVFGVVGLIMYLAPIGAMAYTVGNFGASSLLSLLQLMACFYATCLLFVFGVLGVVARAAGFSIFRFVRYIRDEILLVLGTSSSESALPRMMAKLEAAGASEPVVGLVIPAGYSFNLDGTSIYLTMAAVFLAQATNTPLDIWHQLELLAILLLTSKGAAGVTGSGLIVLAATLGAVGNVPIAALAFIYGIDRFMSEARAMTNLVGNGVATLVVARWCKELDRDKLAAQLARRVS
ncbi:MAG TPA: C4-dicarboxylate transporter DctA [Kofleriaceae bacterium]|nr:C4-dicarboxylate transporter DctA [Kofleriaceae bacterium]